MAGAGSGDVRFACMPRPPTPSPLRERCDSALVSAHLVEEPGAGGTVARAVFKCRAGEVAAVDARGEVAEIKRAGEASAVRAVLGVEHGPVAAAAGLGSGVVEDAHLALLLGLVL